MIEKGTHLRVKLIGTRSDVGSMFAIGSIKEDFLGSEAVCNLNLVMANLRIGHCEYWSADRTYLDCKPKLQDLSQTSFLPYPLEAAFDERPPVIVAHRAWICSSRA